MFLQKPVFTRLVAFSTKDSEFLWILLKQTQGTQKQDTECVLGLSTLSDFKLFTDELRGFKDFACLE